MYQQQLIHYAQQPHLQHHQEHYAYGSLAQAPINGYAYSAPVMPVEAPPAWPSTLVGQPQQAVQPAPQQQPYGGGYARAPPMPLGPISSTVPQPGAGGRGAGGGARGRGRGGGSSGGAPGIHGRGRRSKPAAAGNAADPAVDALLSCVRRMPAGQPLDGRALAQALAVTDSRGVAAALKELARGQAGGAAAREVFDWLCALPPADPLARLCDVYTFTGMVAMCVDGQELARAMGLVEEMRARGIQRNVHTYSALMNVCIKCGQLQQALSVYRTMQAEGCTPNVVTFNTLIDLYGKTGQWAEALAALRQMEAEGIKPVTRTYNTLMIACNASGRWQEALGVYNSMLAAGHTPNTTTYNALISAHSRAGSLDRVMETFSEMVSRGCERSVITYSALISACEKAGQWQAALDLFERMQAEGCPPNVITFNSIITACGQGAQWRQASEIFSQMQRSGFRPDVVTYTALISAFERGGEWLRALEAFRLMQDKGCVPDAILYSALLDTLWDTGVAWAQAKAARLFRQAARQGHFKRPPGPSGQKCELPLQQLSPGMALLALHCWLADLGALAEAGGAAALPAALSISLGRPRQRDAAASALRDSVYALLRSYGSPFAPTSGDGLLAPSSGASGSSSAGGSPSRAEGGGGGGGGGGQARGAGAPGTWTRLEASGPAVAAWVLQENVRHALDKYAPAPLPAAPSGAHASAAAAAAAAVSACPDFDGADDAVAASEAEAGEDLVQISRERAAEGRSRDAFAAVAHFEKTRCLSVQRMGPGYLAARPGVARGAAAAARAAGAGAGAAHDTVLLLDRAASTGAQLEGPGLPALMAACLYLVASTTSDGSGTSKAHAPTAAQVAEAAGVEEAALVEAEAVVRAALQSPDFPYGDLEAISALRCLTLYCDRLAGPEPARLDTQDGHGGERARQIVCAALEDPEFLNYRPSITAAAAMYVARMQLGRLPYWPTALSALTGYSDGCTPELAAAIRGAQRLARAPAGAQGALGAPSSPVRGGGGGRSRAGGGAGAGGGAAAEAGGATAGPGRDGA